MTYINQARRTRRSLGIMGPLPPYSDLSEARLAATRASADLYPLIKNGVLNDGRFPLNFERAVALGWVPHTPEGYFTFLAWGGTSSQRQVEAGLAELYGFNLAMAGHPSETVEQSIAMRPLYLAAQADIWAGYDKGGGLRTGGATPAMAEPYPPGLELVTAGGSHSFTQPSVPTQTFVAWRETHFQPGLQTGGQYGPWHPLPAPWTVRDAGLPAQLSRRVPEGFLGVRALLDEPAALPLVPPGYETLHTPRPAGWDYAEALMANERAMTVWMQGHVPGWVPPYSWQGALADVVPPMAIPQPPDGSSIKVPVAGSTEEPTILLPGATSYVPISQVPASVWDEAARARTAPTVTVSHPDGSVSDTVASGPLNGATGDPMEAGFGTLGMLLIGGLIVGAFVMKKKGGRVKGYRRY